MAKRRRRRRRRPVFEEISSGSRPIEGVGTAVAAFVGLAALVVVAWWWRSRRARGREDYVI